MIASLVEPLVKAAGTDITFWFDPADKEPKSCIDHKTGLTTYYLPQGRYLHIPSTDPDAEYEGDFETP